MPTILFIENFFMSKYLLRFDDISPYMNWELWDEIELLLDLHNIKPIVAIVPDCRDLSIMPSDENPLFWSRVRKWQEKGWSIALHGYQHILYNSDTSSLINISRLSEFSGLTYDVQNKKIRSGLKILHDNGIYTNLWVAPAHSFDVTTLKVLRDNDFLFLSDGLFVSPYTDSNGLFWIPQQLWKLRPMPFGIWTVCYHHNNWDFCDLKKFELDLFKYNKCITNINKVYNIFHSNRKGFSSIIISRIFSTILFFKRIFRHAK